MKKQEGDWLTLDELMERRNAKALKRSKNPPKTIVVPWGENEGDGECSGTG